MSNDKKVTVVETDQITQAEREARFIAYMQCVERLRQKAKVNRIGNVIVTGSEVTE